MKHIKTAAIGAVFSLALLASHSAFAGPYSDEMAKCLVASTSEADKNFLVKWMFAAAALHPAVKSISSISDAQRNELNVKTAIKYEGQSTIESAFQVLGQVAARGLFSDPNVNGFIAQLGNHIDKQKMESVIGAPKTTN